MILLVGILVGVGAVALLGDDDPDTTTVAAEAPTTSAADQVAPTTAPPTTTTTAAASSTTVAPTTTTTTAPTTTAGTTTTSTPTDRPPVADVTTGEILGLPPGTPVADVLAAMNAIYGAPDFDSGWNAGCPLDGGPDDHERVVDYGNLRIRFDRWDRPEQLAGWSYRRGLAGFFDPDGPTPDDIALHDGVAWGQSGNEVAAALGVAINPLDIFGVTFINHPDGTYRADGLDGTTPFFQVGWRAGDICE